MNRILLALALSLIPCLGSATEPKTDQPKAIARQPESQIASHSAWPTRRSRRAGRRLVVQVLVRR